MGIQHIVAAYGQLRPDLNEQLKDIARRSDDTSLSEDDRKLIQTALVDLSRTYPRAHWIQRSIDNIRQQEVLTEVDDGLSDEGMAWWLFFNQGPKASLRFLETRPELAQEFIKTASFVEIRRIFAEEATLWDMPSISLTSVSDGTSTSIPKKVILDHLKEGITIGRSEDLNTIVIHEDSAISRKHAAIRYNQRSNRYILTDLSSHNGTYIRHPHKERAHRVSGEEILEHGSALRVGSTDLVINFHFSDIQEKQKELMDRHLQSLYDDSQKGSLFGLHDHNKRRFSIETIKALLDQAKDHEVLDFIKVNLVNLLTIIGNYKNNSHINIDENRVINLNHMMKGLIAENIEEVLSHALKRLKPQDIKNILQLIHDNVSDISSIGKSLELLSQYLSPEQMYDLISFYDCVPTAGYPIIEKWPQELKQKLLMHMIDAYKRHPERQDTLTTLYSLLNIAEAAVQFNALVPLMDALAQLSLKNEPLTPLYYVLSRIKIKFSHSEKIEMINFLEDKFKIDSEEQFRQAMAISEIIFDSIPESYTGRLTQKGPLEIFVTGNHHFNLIIAFGLPASFELYKKIKSLPNPLDYLNDLKNKSRAYRYGKSLPANPTEKELIQAYVSLDRISGIQDNHGNPKFSWDLFKDTIQSHSNIPLAPPFIDVAFSFGMHSEIPVHSSINKGTFNQLIQHLKDAKNPKNLREYTLQLFLNLPGSIKRSVRKYVASEILNIEGNSFDIGTDENLQIIRTYLSDEENLYKTLNVLYAKMIKKQEGSPELDEPLSKLSLALNLDNPAAQEFLGVLDTYLRKEEKKQVSSELLLETIGHTIEFLEYCTSVSHQQLLAHYVQHPENFHPPTLLSQYQQRLKDALEKTQSQEGAFAYVEIIPSKTRQDSFFGYIGEDCTKNRGQYIFNENFQVFKIIVNGRTDGIVYAEKSVIDGKYVLKISISPRTRSTLNHEKLLERIVSGLTHIAHQDNGIDMIVMSTITGEQGNRTDMHRAISRQKWPKIQLPHNASSKLYRHDTYYEIYNRLNYQEEEPIEDMTFLRRNPENDHWEPYGRRHINKANPEFSDLDDYYKLSLQLKDNEEKLIGRGSENTPVDITIPDDRTISRRHLKVYKREGHYYLEDLGSYMGTTLYRGGRKIHTLNRNSNNSPVEVFHGDLLKAGSTFLELSLDSLEFKSPFATYNDNNSTVHLVINKAVAGTITIGQDNQNDISLPTMHGSFPLHAKLIPRASITGEKKWHLFANSPGANLSVKSTATGRILADINYFRFDSENSNGFEMSPNMTIILGNTEIIYEETNLPNTTDSYSLTKAIPQNYVVSFSDYFVKNRIAQAKSQLAAKMSSSTNPEGSLDNVKNEITTLKSLIHALGIIERADTINTLIKDAWLSENANYLLAALEVVATFADTTTYMRLAKYAAEHSLSKPHMCNLLFEYALKGLNQDEVLQLINDIMDQPAHTKVPELSTYLAKAVHKLEAPKTDQIIQKMKKEVDTGEKRSFYLNTLSRYYKSLPEESRYAGLDYIFELIRNNKLHFSDVDLIAPLFHDLPKYLVQKFLLDVPRQGLDKQNDHFLIVQHLAHIAYQDLSPLDKKLLEQKNLKRLQTPDYIFFDYIRLRGPSIFEFYHLFSNQHPESRRNFLDSWNNERVNLYRYAVYDYTSDSSDPFSHAMAAYASLDLRPEKYSSVFSLSWNEFQREGDHVVSDQRQYPPKIKYTGSFRSFSPMRFEDHVNPTIIERAGQLIRPLFDTNAPSRWLDNFLANPPSSLSDQLSDLYLEKLKYVSVKREELESTGVTSIIQLYQQSMQSVESSPIDQLKSIYPLLASGKQSNELQKLMLPSLILIAIHDETYNHKITPLIEYLSTDTPPEEYPDMERVLLAFDIFYKDLLPQIHKDLMGDNSELNLPVQRTIAELLSIQVSQYQTAKNKAQRVDIFPSSTSMDHYFGYYGYDQHALEYPTKPQDRDFDVMRILIDGTLSGAIYIKNDFKGNLYIKLKFRDAIDQDTYGLIVQTIRQMGLRDESIRSIYLSDDDLTHTLSKTYPVFSQKINDPLYSNITWRHIYQAGRAFIKVPGIYIEEDRRWALAQKASLTKMSEEDRIHAALDMVQSSGRDFFELGLLNGQKSTLSDYYDLRFSDKMFMEKLIDIAAGKITHSTPKEMENILAALISIVPPEDASLSSLATFSTYGHLVFNLVHRLTVLDESGMITPDHLIKLYSTIAPNSVAVSTYEEIRDRLHSKLFNLLSTMDPVSRLNTALQTYLQSTHLSPQSLKFEYNNEEYSLLDFFSIPPDDEILRETAMEAAITNIENGASTHDKLKVLYFTHHFLAPHQTMETWILSPSREGHLLRLSVIEHLLRQEEFGDEELQMARWVLDFNGDIPIEDPHLLLGLIRTSLTKELNTENKPQLPESAIEVADEDIIETQEGENLLAADDELSLVPPALPSTDDDTSLEIINEVEEIAQPEPEAVTPPPLPIPPEPLADTAQNLHPMLIVSDDQKQAHQDELEPKTPLLSSEAKLQLQQLNELALIYDINDFMPRALKALQNGELPPQALFQAPSYEEAMVRFQETAWLVNDLQGIKDFNESELQLINCLVYLRHPTALAALVHNHPSTHQSDGGYNYISPYQQNRAFMGRFLFR